MIEALLEVTPYPPATDDITELLAAADQMVRARDGVLSKAVAAKADASLVAELDARQLAWTVKLAAARARLGNQRVGTRQMRAYAR